MDDLAEDICAEDDCPLCRSVAPILRPLFRLEVFSIPFDRPTCVQCLAAFFLNVGLPVSDEEPRLH